MLKLAIKNRVAGGSQGGSIRSIEKARKENKRNKIELYIYYNNCKSQFTSLGEQCVSLNFRD